MTYCGRSRSGWRAWIGVVAVESGPKEGVGLIKKESKTDEYTNMIKQHVMYSS